METNQNTETKTEESKAYLNYSIKRWILVGITAFAVIFSLIALAFPYITISTTLWEQEASLNGLTAIFGGEYPAILEDEYELASIFSLIHLGASLYCLYSLLDGVLKKDEETTVKRCRWIWIITSVPCICSAFLGEYLFSVANEAIEAEGLIGFVDVSSNAFILTAVDGILFIAHQLLQKFYPDDNTPLLKKASDTPDKLKDYKDLLDSNAISQEDYDKVKDSLLEKNEASQPKDVISELKRYKALLDSNAISQEDYDKIKADLLKNN